MKLKRYFGLALLYYFAAWYDNNIVCEWQIIPTSLQTSETKQTKKTGDIREIEKNIK